LNAGHLGSAGQHVKGNKFEDISGGDMNTNDLATVVGYTSLWHSESNSVSIELALLGGGRKPLGTMNCEQANMIISMLTKNGKKSVSYKDNEYLQVSEFYQFK